MKEKESNKCVHTEHCCILHGCKYGDKNCPVELGNKRQSYLCESCDFGWENTEEQNEALWQEIFTRFKGGTVGKLFGSRTYLIGAMDRVKDHGAGWREAITPELHKLGVMVFNPLNKPTEDLCSIESPESRDLRKQWKSNGEFDKFKSVKKIRTIDLNMTDKADFIIANIDVDVHACGTYEELFWANRCKKPILIHCEQGKENCPDWLFWTVPHCHIFSSWNLLLHHHPPY